MKSGNGGQSPRRALAAHATAALSVVQIAVGGREGGRECPPTESARVPLLDQISLLRYVCRLMAGMARWPELRHDLWTRESWRLRKCRNAPLWLLVFRLHSRKPLAVGAVVFEEQPTFTPII